MVRRYRSGWWLEQKYREEGLTQAEIAEECGVSPRAIRKWMKRRGIQRRDVEGENHPLHGEERDAEVRERISETMKGREFSEEWRERISDAQSGRRLPEGVKEKISEALTGLERPEETRRKMSRSRLGEENPNWRGGVVPRYGPGWTDARRRARKRDKVCQHCGHDGSERILDVHHIIPVRRFREAEDVPLSAAHDLENLVLLCRQCHAHAEHGDIEFDSGVQDPTEG